MSGRAESSECRSRRPTRRPAAIGSTRVHPPCRVGSRKLAFLCISASAGARPAFLCKQDGCCACEDGARGLLPLALGSSRASDLVTRPQHQIWMRRRQEAFAGLARLSPCAGGAALFDGARSEAGLAGALRSAPRRVSGIRCDARKLLEASDCVRAAEWALCSLWRSCPRC